jgi:TolB-like protein
LVDADLRFGRIKLRRETREVFLDGRPVTVGGRAFDLLARLLDKPDEVVTKAQLMDAVWPGLAVVENNLNAQVKALRQALGEKTILTVAGRGYRIGLPSFEGEAASEGTTDKASIAILPFDNMSGDPEQAYFADGVAEEILTALAAFKQLLVIARNSSFIFKSRPTDVREVGRRLGVRYVLEGSVRRTVSRMRITAQLIETEKGAHLWAERFEGDLADIFDLQDAITARVVAAIEPAIRREEIELARRKRPENLTAYDLLLRALPHLYAMTPPDNDVAMELLELALVEEPHFAAGLAHAAWGLEQRLSRSWPNASEADRPRAITYARKALAEDTDDANVIGMAGFVLATTGRDPQSGLSALRRAAALNPRSALVCNFAGTAHLFAGDLEEAQRHLAIAKRLSPSDPTAFFLTTALACAHFLSGDAEAALQMCGQSAAMNPHWDFTWWISAAAAGELGDDAKAREAFANLSRLKLGAPVEFPAFRVFIEASRRDLILHSLMKTGLWAATDG